MTARHALNPPNESEAKPPPREGREGEGRGDSEPPFPPCGSGLRPITATPPSIPTNEREANHPPREGREGEGVPKPPPSP